MRNSQHPVCMATMENEITTGYGLKTRLVWLTTICKGDTFKETLRGSKPGNRFPQNNSLFHCNTHRSLQMPSSLFSGRPVFFYPPAECVMMNMNLHFTACLRWRQHKINSLDETTQEDNKGL